MGEAIEETGWWQVWDHEAHEIYISFFLSPFLPFFFSFSTIIGVGVGAGAYVLSRYAVSNESPS